MTKQQAIETVRRQYLRGDVSAVNVYYRLEQWLSAAEIDALLQEWDKETK